MTDEESHDCEIKRCQRNLEHWERQLGFDPKNKSVQRRIASEKARLEKLKSEGVKTKPTKPKKP